MRTPVVLALLVLVAGCGEERAPGAGEATKPPVEECPESGVRLGSGPVDAAGGEHVLGLDLWNCGTVPYRVAGRPEVVFSDAAGRAVRVRIAAAPSFGRAERSVVLAPGETASAAIHWRNPAGRRPVTAVLDVGRPALRLDGTTIEVSAGATVGVGPWVRSRDATGSQTGDGAPHHADNNGWKRRRELSAADQAAGDLVAGRIRPVLERVRRRGDVAPGTVRAALLAAGLREDRAFTSAFRASAATGEAAPPGAVVDVRVGRAACVTGSVTPREVTLSVHGRNGEGTCIEAFSH
ncbi:DUF4232 domain-containing protein [Actinocorallia longicatena]|uniref:DUF4232 domain-containing protein n=1 Tax=Actinocorallia longicatena TaxID=111803 RepID=A0ABP6Q2L3_9ACTN